VYTALNLTPLTQQVQGQRLLALTEVLNRPRRHPYTSEPDLLPCVLDACVERAQARTQDLHPFWKPQPGNPLGSAEAADASHLHAARGLLRTLVRGLPDKFHTPPAPPDLPHTHSTLYSSRERDRLFEAAAASPLGARPPAQFRPGRWVRFYDEEPTGPPYSISHVLGRSGLVQVAPLEPLPELVSRDGDTLVQYSPNESLAALREERWTNLLPVGDESNWSTRRGLIISPSTPELFDGDPPPDALEARRINQVPYAPPTPDPANAPTPATCTATVLTAPGEAEAEETLCAMDLNNGPPSYPQQLFARFHHPIGSFMAVMALLLIIPTHYNLKIRTVDNQCYKYGWKHSLPRWTAKSDDDFAKSAVFALLRARWGLTTFAPLPKPDSATMRRLHDLLRVARTATLLMAAHIPRELRCYPADGMVSALQHIAGTQRDRHVERWLASDSEGDFFRELHAAHGREGVDRWLDWVHTLHPRLQAFVLRASTRTAGVNALLHTFYPDRTAACSRCGTTETLEHVFACDALLRSLTRGERHTLSAHQPPLSYIVGARFPVGDPASVVGLCDILHSIWVLRCSKRRT